MPEQTKQIVVDKELLPDGLPADAEAARTLAADEYLEHLQSIETMSEHVAVEKWVSFRTGFKYGFTALQAALAASKSREEILRATLERYADKSVWVDDGVDAEVVWCGPGLYGYSVAADTLAEVKKMGEQ
jgi:hypothetical protein